MEILCTKTYGIIMILIFMLTMNMLFDGVVGMDPNILSDFAQYIRISIRNSLFLIEHIEVAQWLIQLSQQLGFTLIDIHVHNEYAFQMSCENGSKYIERFRSIYSDFN